MRNSWLEIVDCLLRPARPEIERCAREREAHMARRKVAGETRARLLRDCESRIERARAVVFEADDGVVSGLMTRLEREWRLLSRPDPDGGLMDLWARVAPASWHDRKRWRDCASGPGGDDRMDCALALASDAAGVEAAEAAVESLRLALAPWGTAIGSRIRWRFFEPEGAEVSEALLAAPLRAALEAIASREGASRALERGRDLEREVQGAVLARLPEHGSLARDVGHAAFVGYAWKAASLDRLPDPVAPLRSLWKTGYVLGTVDASDVRLQLPRP